MKKRGSVLTTVLIVSTILLIFGTAVSAGVINTTKLNEKYSDNIDLELAAKSGLNIVLDDFLKVATTQEAINNYTVNQTDVDNIYNESTGIKVNVSLSKQDDDIVITSEAKDRSNTSNVKIETKIISINNQGSTGDLGGDVNKPENNNPDNNTIEVKAQNILNVKDNIEWVYSELEFLKKVAFGQSLINNQWNVNEYINQNNIKYSNTIRTTTFGLNENNINKELKIANFDRQVREVTNLIETSIGEVSNKIITDKKYIVRGNSKVNGYIKLKNTTVVIDGDLNIDHSINIELDNSNLIIRGSLNVSQNIQITADNNSFVEVTSDLLCRNGTANLIINNNSIVNIYRDLIQDSQSIKIEVKDNSILDVGRKIESNNSVNITLRASKIITRTEGLNAKNNPATIDSENSTILFNGYLNGNTVTVKLKKNSKMNVEGVSAREQNNNLNVTMELSDSKALINGIVKGNYVYNNLTNSEIIYKDNVEVITRFENNINDSVLIINGSVNVVTENMDTKMNNSAILVLNSDRKGVTIKNNFKVNNVKDSYMYILGTIKVESINIYGDSNNITPSYDILNKINLYLDN